MRLTFALLAVAVLLVSGCSSKKGTDGITGSDATMLQQPGDIDATPTTGGIHGIVVDQAIRPIANALIAVGSLNKTVKTSVAGTFVVSGLAPGDYLIKVSHPLFDSAQQVAKVVAGVRDPQDLKIQLTQRIFDKPYLVTTHFKGFIVCSVGAAVVASEECGEGVGVPCQAPQPYGCHRAGGQGDNYVQYDFFPDSAQAKSIVYEQVWTPNSDATGNLYTVLALNWTCDPSCGGNELHIAQGTSPLIGRVDMTENGTVKGSGGEVPVDGTAKFSTFTWPAWGAFCLDNPPTPACAQQNAQANYAANQPFDLFVTTSYVLPLPEGWSFVANSPDPFK